MNKFRENFADRNYDMAMIVCTFDFEDYLRDAIREKAGAELVNYSSKPFLEEDARDIIDRLERGIELTHRKNREIQRFLDYLENKVAESQNWLRSFEFDFNSIKGSTNSSMLMEDLQGIAEETRRNRVALSKLQEEIRSSLQELRFNTEKSIEIDSMVKEAQHLIEKLEERREFLESRFNIMKANRERYRDQVILPNPTAAAHPFTAAKIRESMLVNEEEFKRSFGIIPFLFP